MLFVGTTIAPILSHMLDNIVAAVSFYKFVCIRIHKCLPRKINQQHLQHVLHYFFCYDFSLDHLAYFIIVWKFLYTSVIVLNLLKKWRKQCLWKIILYLLLLSFTRWIDFKLFLNVVTSESWHKTCSHLNWKKIQTKSICWWML